MLPYTCTCVHAHLHSHMRAWLRAGQVREMEEQLAEAENERQDLSYQVESLEQELEVLMHARTRARRTRACTLAAALLFMLLLSGCARPAFSMGAADANGLIPASISCGFVLLPCGCVWPAGGSAQSGPHMTAARSPQHP